MNPFLFIVARNQPYRLDYLRQALSGEAEVQVILDRREGERRQRVQAAKAERRRADRRRLPENDDKLRSFGFVITREQETS